MIFHKLTSDILVRYENDPLAGYSKAEFIQTLTKRLSGRIDQLWLFGSLARNELHRDSDVDLLLVCDTVRPYNERVRDFEDLYDLGPELDILVYTAEEFDRIRQEPSAGFWQSVVSSMVRVL